MKKLLLLFAFVVLTITINAQSILRPVPKDLFKATVTTNYLLQTPQITQLWLWRLSAAVTATELTYNKTTKRFDSNALSSVGPAIGYRHFTQLADGTPYNDVGINLALLIGMDIEKVDPPGDAFRDLIDPESIRELAESIRSQGLHSPILTRPLNGRFKINQGISKIAFLHL